MRSELRCLEKKQKVIAFYYVVTKSAVIFFAISKTFRTFAPLFQKTGRSRQKEKYGLKHNHIK